MGCLFFCQWECVYLSAIVSIYECWPVTYFFKNYITFLLSALSEFPSQGQISIRCLVPALSISKQPQHQAPYLTTGHTSRMYRIDRHRRWPEALAINHRLITAQHETAQHGLHPFFGFTLAQLRRTTEWMVHWYVAIIGCCRTQPASSIRITSMGWGLFF